MKGQHALSFFWHFDFMNLPWRQWHIVWYPKEILWQNYKWKDKHMGFLWKKYVWFPQNIMRKKGVLQLALQLGFELHQTFATHHIYMLWVLLDKLQELQELQVTIYTMQLITTQLQLCRNNSFSTTMQLPYDYNHNIMLMSSFIHPSKFNMWQYKDFLMIF
jgi:hypothetical protein